MKRPPEMSRRQFRETIKRRGFRQILMWFEDTTGECPGVSWGAILHMNGKMAYRATLAKIIRERDAEIAKREPLPMTAAKAEELSRRAT